MAHLGVAALSTAALAAVVHAAPPAAEHAVARTTAPDVYVNIKVTMTDTKFVLDKHAGPRGADARFVIHNVGTAKHAFTLGTAKPGSARRPASLRRSPRASRRS